MQTLPTALGGLLRRFLLQYPSYVGSLIQKEDETILLLRRNISSSLKELFPSSFCVESYVGKRKYSNTPYFLVRDSSLFKKNHGVSFIFLFDMHKRSFFLGLSHQSSNLFPELKRKEKISCTFLLSETMRYLLEEKRKERLPGVRLSLKKCPFLNASTFFAFRYDYFSLQDDLLLLGIKKSLHFYQEILAIIHCDYEGIWTIIKSQILSSTYKELSSLRNKLKEKDASIFQGASFFHYPDLLNRELAALQPLNLEEERNRKEDH